MIACSIQKTETGGGNGLGTRLHIERSHSQAEVGGMGTRLYSMWARILAWFAAMAQGAAAKRKPKGESCWYVNAQGYTVL